jgi:hypothetical protein
MLTSRSKALSHVSFCVQSSPVYRLLSMLSSRFRSLILALLICCLKFVQVAQAQPAFADYTTPPSGQVTVPPKVA